MQRITTSKDNPRRRVDFTLESDTTITQTEALEAQRQKGYPAGGYGFGGFKVEERPGIDLPYVATWCCSQLAD